MGLISGIDDWTLEGGLEANLFLEEVGSLSDLEVDVLPTVLRPDLARSREDLPRDQKRRGVADDIAKWSLPRQKVVLVGALRIALAVGIVLVERDPFVRDL